MGMIVRYFKMDNKDTLKKLQKEYDKVCEKLEQLNERAFELEKEMIYIKEVENGRSNL